MGSVGGLLVVLLLLRGTFSRRSRIPLRERIFWGLGAPFCFALGLATHRLHDRFGLMHIGGQTLVYCGLTLLAAQLPLLGRRVRVLWLHGLALDATLGMGLQVYTGSSMEDWASSSNWGFKYAKSAAYLGDHFAGFEWLPKLVAVAVALVFGWVLVRTILPEVPARAGLVEPS